MPKLEARKVTCPRCGKDTFTKSPKCFCIGCFARWTIKLRMSPEEFWSFNSSSKAQRIIAERAEKMGVDTRSLNILFNTQWELDGREGTWIEFSEVPKVDLEYAKSHGIMRDSLEFDHRSIVSKTIKARDVIDRRSVAAAFVSSLATRRLDTRSTLGSYARALHLCSHRFRGKEGGCLECGFPKEGTMSLNHFTFRRIMWAGNVYQGDLGYIFCDLLDFTESDADCSRSDKALIKKVFSSIRKLPRQAGLSELEKSISGLFPANKSERQVVLEILGSCGILQPKDRPSMHAQWIPKSELPHPTHFYRKEWRSPVNCWTGADGVNEEAIDFWFGDL